METIVLISIILAAIVVMVIIYMVFLRSKHSNETDVDPFITIPHAKYHDLYKKKRQ